MAYTFKYENSLETSQNAMQTESEAMQSLNDLLTH